MQATRQFPETASHMNKIIAREAHLWTCAVQATEPHDPGIGRERKVYRLVGDAEGKAVVAFFRNEMPLVRFDTGRLKPFEMRLHSFDPARAVGDLERHNGRQCRREHIELIEALGRLFFGRSASNES